MKNTNIISFCKYYLDVKSGILRMWNVSKSTPIENIRIKKTGIHALQTINVEHHSRVKDVRDGQVSSTSPTLTPASTNSSHFVLPPAKIVCAFLDGGVGLYDLGGRKWDFLRDQVSICKEGHWSQLSGHCVVMQRGRETVM